MFPSCFETHLLLRKEEATVVTSEKNQMSSSLSSSSSSQLTVLNWRLVVSFLEDGDIFQLLQAGNITIADAIDSDYIWAPIAADCAAIEEGGKYNDAQQPRRNPRGAYRATVGQTAQQQQPAQQRPSSQRQIDALRAKSYVKQPLSATLEQYFYHNGMHLQQQSGLGRRKRVSSSSPPSAGRVNLPSVVSEPERLAVWLLRAIGESDEGVAVGKSHAAVAAAPAALSSASATAAATAAIAEKDKEENNEDDAEFLSAEQEEEYKKNALNAPIFLFRSKSYRKYIALRLVRLLPATVSHLVLCAESNEVQTAVSSVFQILRHIVMPLWDDRTTRELDSIFFFNKTCYPASYIQYHQYLLELLDDPARTVKDEDVLYNLCQQRNFALGLGARQRNFKMLQQQHDLTASQATMLENRQYEVRFPLFKELIRGNPWLRTPMRELLIADLELAAAVTLGSESLSEGMRIAQFFTIHIFSFCVLFGVTFAEGIQFYLWPMVSSWLGMSLSSFFEPLTHLLEGIFQIVSANIGDLLRVFRDAAAAVLGGISFLAAEYAPPLFTVVSSTLGLVNMIFATIGSWTTTPAINMISSISNAKVSTAFRKGPEWEHSNLFAMGNFPGDIFRGHPLNEKLGLQDNAICPWWLPPLCFFGLAVLVNTVWTRRSVSCNSSSGGPGKKPGAAAAAAATSRAAIAWRCRVAAAIIDAAICVFCLGFLSPIESFLSISTPEESESFLFAWAKSSEWFKTFSDFCWLVMLGEGPVRATGSMLPGGPVRHNLVGVLVHQLMPLSIIGMCRVGQEIFNEMENNNSGVVDSIRYVLRSAWKKRAKVVKDVLASTLYGVAAVSVRWSLYRQFGDSVGWKTGVAATLALRMVGLCFELVPSLF